jgi:ParB-like chromosome segregation protein Spo0J
MVTSIREYGFAIPILARRSGENIEVIDGHLRLKAARKLVMTVVPVIFCDEWSEAQVKAFRLLVNRSVNWATWDEELVALELKDLDALEFALSLTGFERRWQELTGKKAALEADGRTFEQIAGECEPTQEVEECRARS